MNRIASSALIVLGMVSVAWSQNLNIYIPAGFRNPLLQRGQFISSLYFYGDQVTTTQDIKKTRYSRNDINFLGYLGITENITLKTHFIISPSQTIQKVLEGGKGENISSFSLTPEITLSYRPNMNVEIYSSVYYSNQTTRFGERGEYVEIPVGTGPITGEIIYETRLVSFPGQPDLDTSNSTFIVGLSFMGKLC